MASDASTSTTATLVLEDADGPIQYLTLNRPDRHNALSAELLSSFDQALDRAEHNDDRRVVVIRGAGRSFSAGFDIVSNNKGYSETHRDPLDDRAQLMRMMQRWLRVWEFPKPVIAQVHGNCLAGATQLAAASDITIVAEDATIGGPALPTGGGFITPMWVHLVGPKRAKEISYCAGSKISGTVAADWGWANRAVPATRLAEEVRTLALRIAATPPGVLMMKKASINRTMELAGFRIASMAGVDVDALLHASPQTLAIRQLISDVGLRGAIQAFGSAFAGTTDKSKI